MIDNKKMDIKMNGKEYLEYLKYKDKKTPGFKWNNLTNGEQLIVKIFGIGVVTVLFCVLLWSAFSLMFPTTSLMFPTTPEPSRQLTIRGVTMFLLICAGLGWVIHGTGFLIIKR